LSKLSRPGPWIEKDIHNLGNRAAQDLIPFSQKRCGVRMGLDHQVESLSCPPKYAVRLLQELLRNQFVERKASPVLARHGCHEFESRL
jgi:hypothetical protein